MLGAVSGSLDGVEVVRRCRQQAASNRTSRSPASHRRSSRPRVSTCGFVVRRPAAPGTEGWGRSLHTAGATGRNLSSRDTTFRSLGSTEPGVACGCRRNVRFCNTDPADHGPPDVPCINARRYRRLPGPRPCAKKLVARPRQDRRRGTCASSPNFGGCGKTGWLADLAAPSSANPSPWTDPPARSRQAKVVRSDVGPRPAPV